MGTNRERLGSKTKRVQPPPLFDKREKKTPRNETQIEGHEEAMGVCDVNARSGL